MKALYILATVALLGCSEMASSAGSATECEFGYGNLSSCSCDDYGVAIQSSRLAADEIQLKSMLVSYRGKQQLLEVSPDTSMFDGDKGVVLFDDINFDGIPDVAISTSFGLANQYVDYWIFDAEKDQFSRVGNYVRFSLHPSDKSLSNTVKDDAVTYQDNEYFWWNGKLVKK